MKDCNGKTLRKGDVCVVHYSPETDEPIFECFEGEACEILKKSIIPRAFDCQMFSSREQRVIYAQELEIIGDVRKKRERAK